MFFIMSLFEYGFLKTNIFKINTPAKTTDVSESVKDSIAIFFKLGT